MTADAALARLLARLDTSDPDGCWLVPGPQLRYPQVSVDGRSTYVSHLLLDVEPGQVRRHTCDNRRCVNRRHLIPGSRADNMLDKVERGRHLRGSQMSQAKLTEDQVRSIRLRLRAGATGRGLAREFGVSEALISFIRNRRAWPHVAV